MKRSNTEMLTVQKRTLEIMAQLPGFEGCAKLDPSKEEDYAKASEFSEKYNLVGPELFDGKKEYMPILDELKRLGNEYEDLLAEMRGGVCVGLRALDMSSY